MGFHIVAVVIDCLINRERVASQHPTGCDSQQLPFLIVDILRKGDVGHVGLLVVVLVVGLDVGVAFQKDPLAGPGHFGARASGSKATIKMAARIRFISVCFALFAATVWRSYCLATLTA